MARINIEDNWWFDPRRSALIQKVGSEEFADGLMVKIWRIGQEYWKKDKTLVPKNIFFFTKFSKDLIECGLAKECEQGVYVCGIEEQCEFLVTLINQRKEAGRKSAQSRLEKYGTAQPSSNPRTNSERTSNAPERAFEREPNEPNSSSSSSKEKKKKSLSQSTSSTLPDIALIWNQEIRDPLARVRGIDPRGKRGKAASARWDATPDPEFWRQVIAKVKASSFCTGSNDRGWKANFDWLIKPDTADKILEGQYDDRSNHANGLSQEEMINRGIILEEENEIGLF